LLKQHGFDEIDRRLLRTIIDKFNGGPVGVGLGESVQKIFYLPEAHTDMIFAVIGEELGLVGAASVIFAYVLFAWAGLKTALECRDPFGKRLAAGITALICGQAAVNVSAVMGIAPLTGIPLPFVSYGGSSLVVGLAAVGILLNIAGDERAPERKAVRRSPVPDRRGRNGRPRVAVAGGGGGASRARGRSDLRRVAGSGRG